MERCRYDTNTGGGLRRREHLKVERYGEISHKDRRRIEHLKVERCRYDTNTGGGLRRREHLKQMH